MHNVLLLQEMNIMNNQIPRVEITKAEGARIKGGLIKTICGELGCKNMNLSYVPELSLWN